MLLASQKITILYSSMNQNILSDKLLNEFVSREEVYTAQRRSTADGFRVTIRTTKTEPLFCKKGLSEEDGQNIQKAYERLQLEAKQGRILYGQYTILHRLHRVFHKKLSLDEIPPTIPEFEEAHQVLPQIIMFNGPAASGKTHHAFSVATKLGLTAVDADIFHPRTNVEKMSKGQPLDDAHRTAWITNTQNAVRQLLLNNAKISIAFPGHTEAQRQSVRHLAQNTQTIQCICDLEDLKLRVAEREHPYIPKDCTALLERQLAILQPLTTAERVNGGMTLVTRNSIPYDKVQYHLHESLNDKLGIRGTKAQL